MHPIAKFLLLACIWICFGSVILSLLLVPFALAKGAEAYAKKKDVKDFIKAGSEVSWVQRATTALRWISFCAFVGAILVVAAQAIWARFSR